MRNSNHQTCALLDCNLLMLTALSLTPGLTCRKEGRTKRCLLGNFLKTNFLNRDLHQSVQHYSVLRSQPHKKHLETARIKCALSHGWSILLIKCLWALPNQWDLLVSAVRISKRKKFLSCNNLNSQMRTWSSSLLSPRSLIFQPSISIEIGMLTLPSMQTWTNSRHLVIITKTTSRLLVKETSVFLQDHHIKATSNCNKVL